jgi:hypothetical protein
VVDKDSCTPVPLFGEFPFHLRVESDLSRPHLVDGDALPQLGRDKDLALSLGFSDAPWDPGHRTKETSSALGWLDFCKLLGDFPFEGELL